MVTQRDEVLIKISRAIAASKYPYSGAALVCLPSGKQVTRDEYWSTLSPELKEEYLSYAYAAYVTMADFGMDIVMTLATQDYMDEK